MKPLLLLPLVFSKAIVGQVKSELTVRLGESAIIPCKFSADIGAEHVVWLKGTKFLGIAKNNLQSHKRYSIQHSQNDYSLKITDVSVSDDGIFSCQQQINPSTTTEHVIKLNVISPPTTSSITTRNVKQTSTKVSIVKDRPNVLECLAEKAKPAADVHWLRNGEVIRDTQILEVTDDQSSKGLYNSIALLTLSSDDIKNGNQLECVIKHPALSNPVTRSVEFDILTIPTASLTTINPHYAESSDVELTCNSFSAKPSPHVYHFYLNDRIILSSNSNKYLFKSADRSLNSKTLSCVAENHAGKSNHAKLESDIIAFGPELLSKNQFLIQEAENSKFTLDCPVQSNPTPVITWYKITDEGPIRVSSTATLEIPSLQYSHAGQYFCTAENKFTKLKIDSPKTTVKVTGKPAFVNENGEILQDSKVEQLYELSNPVVSIRFVAIPEFNFMSLDFFNNLEIINLSKRQTKRDFSLGSFEVKNNLIIITFTDCNKIPEYLELKISNSLGDNSITIFPRQADTIGRITAIISGSIAGIILIMAVIVSLMLYNKRATRSRTYNTATFQKGETWKESNDVITPSLSSSQRDDGYITEHSGNDVITDATSDSVDVGKLSNMVSTSTLKVLPAIIQMPSPVRSKESEALLESERILPDCNEIVITPRSGSGSSLEKSSIPKVFTDNYDAQNIRTVYEKNFGSFTGSSVNSDCNVYKTLKKKQKSGGKVRSLTKV